MFTKQPLISCWVVWPSPVHLLPSWELSPVHLWLVLNFNCLLGRGIWVWYFLEIWFLSNISLTLSRSCLDTGLFVCGSSLLDATVLWQSGRCSFRPFFRVSLYACYWGRAAAWGCGGQYQSGLSPCPVPGVPSPLPFITGVTDDCQTLSSICQYLVVILGLPKSGLQVLAQPVGESASSSFIHRTELMASPAPHDFCRRTPELQVRGGERGDRALISWCHVPRILPHPLWG